MRRFSRPSIICRRCTAWSPMSSPTTFTRNTSRRSSPSMLDRPLIGVQHHHAHAASCMVEHGRVEPVLAVCFDGLGFGPDGSLWGGEFLLADFAGFRRVGHLRPVVMPGGAAAIREPWRMAASWLATALGADDRGRAADVDRSASGCRCRSGSARRGAENDRRWAALRQRCRAARRTTEGHVRGASGNRARGGRQDRAARRRSERVMPGSSCPARNTASPSSIPVRCSPPSSPTSMPASRSPCSPPPSTRRSARPPANWRHHSPPPPTSTPSPSPAACSRTCDSPKSSNRRCARQGATVLAHAAIPANDGGISIGQAAIAAWRSTMLPMVS